MILNNFMVYSHDTINNAHIQQDINNISLMLHTVDTENGSLLLYSNKGLVFII